MTENESIKEYFNQEEFER